MRDDQNGGLEMNNGLAVAFSKGRRVFWMEKCELWDSGLCHHDSVQAGAIQMAVGG